MNRDIARLIASFREVSVKETLAGIIHYFITEYKRKDLTRFDCDYDDYLWAVNIMDIGDPWEGTFFMQCYMWVDRARILPGQERIVHQIGEHTDNNKNLMTIPNPVHKLPIYTRCHCIANGLMQHIFESSGISPEQPDTHFSFPCSINMEVVKPFPQDMEKTVKAIMEATLHLN